MNKFLRFTVSWAKYLVRPFFPVKFFGDSKIPTKKLLLMGNHLSAMDPVVQALYTKEVPSYVYKSELAKSKFLKWIFDGLDLIPVNRGESDLHATRQIMRRLKDNRVVGIFPEGTRNLDVDCLQEFKHGTVLFALKTKAPIKPFYIWDRYRLFVKNYVIYGEEFDLSDFYDKPITKELIAEASKFIQDKIDALRLQLNEILQQKGIKRRPRTKKEIAKLNQHLQKQAEQSQEGE